MIDGKRWPREIGVQVGSEILDCLFGSVDKAVVAGSVRRNKAEVGDVELLFVPLFIKRPDPADMFAFIDVNLADDEITRMVHSGILEKRLNVKGHETYGPQNKLLRHVKTGMPVDLFATSLENWHVSLVIRTGSKETNLKLTTGAQRLGRKLNAYGSGVTILTEQIFDNVHYHAGDQIAATSEEEVFRLCGVPFLPPEAR